MLDNSQFAFLTLLKAGLWAQEARLSQYSDIDYSAIMKLAEEQAVMGLVTTGLEHVKDIKIPKEWALQFIGNTIQIEQQNKGMNEFKESRGQDLSYTHYTPINTIYSLMNRYLSIA